jgi:predicted proteasome-type protease
VPARRGDAYLQKIQRSWGEGIVRLVGEMPDLEFPPPSGEDAR